MVMDDNRDDSSRSASGRALHLGLFAALLVLAGWTFRASLAQMWRTWDIDPSFTHGFLIGPVAVWLLWRERHVLAAVPLRTNAWGVLLVAAACVAWAVAYVLDVRVVAQLAAVAAVPCLVLAVLGGPVLRAAIFPLAFLVFMVPFGKDLVPTLMRITADMLVFFLKLSGIPVLREGMLLHIPAGTYEVARACSGIKYLTTAAVLGTLYAYVMYASWRKRIIAVVVALAVAVLANGLRAYMLVLIGHVSDMRFDHDGWHVVLGQVLFALVMLGMFVLGHRFRDPDSAFQSLAARAAAAPGSPKPLRVWIVALVSTVLLLMAGRAAHPELVQVAESSPPPTLALPRATGDWTGPMHSVPAWQPRYSKALSVARGTYGRDPVTVDVFVAAYRAPPGAAGEMISHHNQIDPEMTERQFREQVLHVTTESGARGTAREVWVSRGARRLVAYWFVVNGQSTTNRYVVKWLEFRSLVSGRVAEERVVVVSTEGDNRMVLQDFLSAHGEALGLVPRE